MAYIDDVYFNGSTMSAEYVRVKLAQYERMPKDPKSLRDGAHMLGLEVCEEHNTLQWIQGSVIPNVSYVMTWWNISLCKKLVEHLTMVDVWGDWVHQAAGTCNHKEMG